MTCAWKELLSVLPIWMRDTVDKHENDGIQELRLRMNSPPEIVLASGSQWIGQAIRYEDLQFCVNAATGYSPWTAETSSMGYITISGGHRIGICGDVVIKNGAVSGFRRIFSLCIRIARDIPGIGRCAEEKWGSFIILGAPGWGKTTLLRDCVRVLSEKRTVAVIDERKELFPSDFSRGKRMDVLSGCPKTSGIEIMIRTMGPEYIAVDEITAAEDCGALVKAVGCGVKLAATAHASSMKDFLSRPIYRPLVEYKLFETAIILKRNKSFTVERICGCT